jgi:hypothetical protein
MSELTQVTQFEEDLPRFDSILRLSPFVTDQVPKKHDVVKTYDICKTFSYLIDSIAHASSWDFCTKTALVSVSCSQDFARFSAKVLIFWTELRNLG